MKCQTLFSGTNQISKYFKMSSVDFFSLTVQVVCVIIISVSI